LPTRKQDSRWSIESWARQAAAAYRSYAELDNLLLDPYFSGILTQYQTDWRSVVSLAAECGIASPGFSASLSYYDSLCDQIGPLNFLQAQRDCFGAHTFRRTDRDGVFRSDWKAD